MIISPDDYILNAWEDTEVYDHKALDSNVKLMKMKLKVLEMMREDIWLKQKQDIIVHTWRTQTLWKGNLGI